ATAGEVIAALGPYAEEAPATPGSRLHLPRRQARSRSPLILGGIGVTLVALLAVGLGVYFSREPSNTSAGPIVSAQSPTAPTAVPDLKTAVLPAPKPTTVNPDSKPPVPVVASRYGDKELYRLNLDGHERFLNRIENKEFFGSPTFPESWQGFCWKEGSV